jgi:regulator of protease activity HflC (stomatin/prohibitin superfamily)
VAAAGERGRLQERCTQLEAELAAVRSAAAAERDELTTAWSAKVDAALAQAAAAKRQAAAEGERAAALEAARAAAVQVRPVLPAAGRLCECHHGGTSALSRGSSAAPADP